MMELITIIHSHIKAISAIVLPSIFLSILFHLNVPGIPYPLDIHFSIVPHTSNHLPRKINLFLLETHF